MKHLALALAALVVAGAASASEDTTHTTAAEYAKAYQANAIAADAVYLDHRLSVTGVVDRVGKTNTGDALILLRAGVLVFDVNRFTAAKLKRGQHVTATCTGAGTQEGAAALRDCFIR